MRSIESLEPKLLAAIDKLETNEDLKSYFEAISACVLPCDPVSRKKSYSREND